jgi:hypothetical protein
VGLNRVEFSEYLLGLFRIDIASDIGRQLSSGTGIEDEEEEEGKEVDVDEEAAAAAVTVLFGNVIVSSDPVGMIVIEVLSY